MLLKNIHPSIHPSNHWPVHSDAALQPHHHPHPQSSSSSSSSSVSLYLEICLSSFFTSSFSGAFAPFPLGILARCYLGVHVCANMCFHYFRFLLLQFQIRMFGHFPELICGCRLGLLQFALVRVILICQHLHQIIFVLKFSSFLPHFYSPLIVLLI